MSFFNFSTFNFSEMCPYRNCIFNYVQFYMQIFDGTNVTRDQRRELHNYCVNEMGFRIVFIECVCEDQELLERNIIEILHYSADYKGMTEDEAVDDLRKKLEHYMRQYEPVDASVEDIHFVRVENMGETVTAHKVSGQKESGILGYLSGMRTLPQTLYFTRVSFDNTIKGGRNLLYFLNRSEVLIRYRSHYLEIISL